ncbi:uncharacterized protein CIMG_08246 [Coccidioides immitis RS]|uniref:Zn(2)-C6 fungal-type domain-containing protein n=1 Tax=Coccidioides immitis (strain RS) TaxID=246410 RepID=A0A0E1S154_COCIM|nr:uncharacterized protein CIMG_08246 [Coccidioides immitis RS]EAS29500.2 hypothetical protein CIMG_08246 [Coccidioides immitis RS]
MTDGRPQGWEPTDPMRILYPHFAIDDAGNIRYHTSRSVEQSCHHIFGQDVEDRILHLAGLKPYHIPSEQTRWETFNDLYVKEDRVGLQIGDREKIGSYYHVAFSGFQQINCCTISKAWIKLIEPKKQTKHPYNGGQGADGEKGDPERTKPDWWPSSVMHKEPDHLKKSARLRLLTHLIRELAISHNITADKLEEAGRDVQRQIKPRERWDILEEIYMVRRMEESYERGEISANTMVYVIDRPKPGKEKLDSSSGAGVESSPDPKPDTITSAVDIQPNMETKDTAPAPEAPLGEPAPKHGTSEAGMDSADGCAKRKHAEKACQSCRARKVRCSFSEHGTSCCLCKLGGLECIIRERKRERKRPTRTAKKVPQEFQPQPQLLMSCGVIHNMEQEALLRSRVLTPVSSESGDIKLPPNQLLNTDMHGIGTQPQCGYLPDAATGPQFHHNPSNHHALGRQSWPPIPAHFGGGW